MAIDCHRTQSSFPTSIGPLENAQDLPDGYRIWRDVVSGAVAGFYSTAAAQDGRATIETESQWIWEGCGEFERPPLYSLLRFR